MPLLKNDGQLKKKKLSNNQKKRKKKTNHPNLLNKKNYAHFFFKSRIVKPK